MATRWLNRRGARRAPVTSGDSLVPMERRLWWGFGVGLALLGLVGLTAYSEVVKLRNNDAWVDHTHQVISSLRKVQSLVSDAETGQRGYLITGDKLFLRPYTEAVTALDGELATLRKLIADNPEQQEGLREMQASTAMRMEQLRHVLALQEGKGTSAAAQEILTLEGMRTGNALRQVGRLMEEREDRLLREREQAALRTSESSRRIIVLGSMLAFGFVGVALFLIVRDFAGTRYANAALLEAKEHLETRIQERTVDLELEAVGRQLAALVRLLGGLDLIREVAADRGHDAAGLSVCERRLVLQITRRLIARVDGRAAGGGKQGEAQNRNDHTAAHGARR